MKKTFMISNYSEAVEHIFELEKEINSLRQFIVALSFITAAFAGGVIYLLNRLYG